VRVRVRMRVRVRRGRGSVRVSLGVGGTSRDPFIKSENVRNHAKITTFKLQGVSHVTKPSKAGSQATGFS
jgi:hypothetical protein